MGWSTSQSWWASETESSGRIVRTPAVSKVVWCLGDEVCDQVVEVMEESHRHRRSHSRDKDGGAAGTVFVKARIPGCHGMWEIRKLGCLTRRQPCRIMSSTCRVMRSQQYAVDPKKWKEIYRLESKQDHLWRKKRRPQRDENKALVKRDATGPCALPCG